MSLDAGPCCTVHGLEYGPGAGWVADRRHLAGPLSRPGEGGGSQGLSRKTEPPRLEPGQSLEPTAEPLIA